jgi:hypothetical protein
VSKWEVQHYCGRREEEGGNIEKKTTKWERTKRLYHVPAMCYSKKIIQVKQPTKNYKIQYPACHPSIPPMFALLSYPFVVVAVPCSFTRRHWKYWLQALPSRFIEGLSNIKYTHTIYLYAYEYTYIYITILHTYLYYMQTTILLPIYYDAHWCSNFLSQTWYFTSYSIGA